VGDDLARETLITVTRGCQDIHTIIASSPAQVDNTWTKVGIEFYKDSADAVFRALVE
jgi:hypothetical protein